jgi:hypothetical protein
MAPILTAEEACGALPPNALMSMTVAASAFAWNRRPRLYGSTESNSAHRAVRGGLDR